MHVSESTVRKMTKEAFEGRGAEIDAKYERWVQSRLELLRQNGMLISRQQEIDLRSGRSWQVGDAARFVGETRDEDGYRRPQGQYGYISEVTTEGTITFEPEDENAPALIVAEGTQSFWLLERAPDRAPPAIFAAERARRP